MTADWNYVQDTGAAATATEYRSPFEQMIKVLQNGSRKRSN
jgi:hypothetical protein